MRYERSGETVASADCPAASDVGLPACARSIRRSDPCVRALPRTCGCVARLSRHAAASVCWKSRGCCRLHGELLPVWVDARRGPRCPRSWFDFTSPSGGLRSERRRALPDRAKRMEPSARHVPAVRSISVCHVPASLWRIRAHRRGRGGDALVACGIDSLRLSAGDVVWLAALVLFSRLALCAVQALISLLLGSFWSLVSLVSFLVVSALLPWSCLFGDWGMIARSSLFSAAGVTPQAGVVFGLLIVLFCWQVGGSYAMRFGLVRGW